MKSHFNLSLSWKSQTQFRGIFIDLGDFQDCKLCAKRTFAPFHQCPAVFGPHWDSNWYMNTLRLYCWQISWSKVSEKRTVGSNLNFRHSWPPDDSPGLAGPTLMFYLYVFFAGNHENHTSDVTVRWRMKPSWHWKLASRFYNLLITLHEDSINPEKQIILPEKIAKPFSSK